MTALLVAAVLGGVPAALEAAGAHPGSVRDIQYIGANHLSTWELRDLTGICPGDRMDPRRNELGRQAIIKKHQEDGRYFASVKLVEGNKPTDTRVVYSVVEGPVVKVAAVELVGNEHVTAGRLRTQFVKKDWSLQAGSRFDPVTPDLGRKALLDYYRAIELPDVTVTVEVKTSVDRRRVTIVYHIAEAPE
jgi:outer membrane protein assembly factor BamA